MKGITIESVAWILLLLVAVLLILLVFSPLREAILRFFVYFIDFVAKLVLNVIRSFLPV